MREALQEFLVSYWDAADRFMGGELWVEFPPDCFPSRLPYVSPA